MAAPPPTSVASRKSRESSHQEMTIGSFKRMEEIGRGSFATVYKAVHLVHPSQLDSQHHQFYQHTRPGWVDVTTTFTLPFFGSLMDAFTVDALQELQADPIEMCQKSKSFVAIKSVVLSKLNKKLKDNLTSEIDILKGLHHPHIVALIDCRESTSHIHLVMEFCALGDLSYFIRKRDSLGNHDATRDMILKYSNPRDGGLNEVIVRHFLKQLASALEFLRDRNLIHRDLKPQNLLLNPSPSYYAKYQPAMIPFAATEKSLIPLVGIESLPMLKIADFGFARSLPSTSLAETLCGSPLYMAPEILRYEKYDAKADLWSVGTVLYEMSVGKPPFRAANHVELLRKIERGDDRIKFPEDNETSDGLKKLIRGLLKRAPVERMTFVQFFNDEVVKGDIPGLVGEDRPPAKPRSIVEAEASEISRRKSSISRDVRQADVKADHIHPTPLQTRPLPNPLHQRTSSGTPPSPSPLRRVTSRDRTSSVDSEQSPTTPTARRPGSPSHATAPGRQEKILEKTPVAAAVVMERQRSRNSPSPSSSLLREQVQARTRDRNSLQDDKAIREARERAAQDVAFERDYVVVEKRAVEVNAFADELAASPRIHGGQQGLQVSPQSGAMVRRATTQGTPTSTTGAQVAPARVMQIASGGQRPTALHHRQGSYERRYGPSPGSATSAISKALNLASGRLFGVGFSPQLAIGRTGRSPPLSYNPFPAYPTNQGSLVVVGDGSKTQAPLDEDSKAVHVIEECAHRSDVVYGFAEVKYKQLIPLAPSMQDAGITPRQTVLGGHGSASPEDEGLTVDAIVTLSEEALVLYVKALALLAKSMDIAGAWWTRKNRGEIIPESQSPRTYSTPMTSPAVGNRINNVVQWVRNRFNEVLEKAELVRLKLIEGQKRLPLDHASHPNNFSSEASDNSRGSSTDHVVVSPGVTAEKLMYDRALEMSRSAAINELTGEDLAGCEVAYITAIRMLEAVLESDEEVLPRKRSNSEVTAKSASTDGESINGVEAEDRKVVVKRKCLIISSSVPTRLTFCSRC
jgi:serine/threonine-protein kinase ULK/ATG1